MLKKLGISTLALAAAMAVATPAATFARDRGDHGRGFERHDYGRTYERRDFRDHAPVFRDYVRPSVGFGVYVNPAPAANGYYDQYGVWHPYGYYDQFGVWHASY